jgi:hypothetical protein
MEDQELGPQEPLRRKRVPAKGVVAAIFAAGLVIGAIVAGLNVAGAQTPTPSASPSEGTRAEKPYGRFGHGFGHFGFGPGVLHGEFTTADPDGGYQTLASQVGEVTSVSASSVTVKSEDGFSRRYSVDDNTLVNAGNEGIDDVKEGDTVRVLAVVDGSTARAVDIVDGTNVDRLRGRWMPPPPMPPSSSSSSTTSSSSTA